MKKTLLVLMVLLFPFSGFAADPDAAEYQKRFYEGNAFLEKGEFDAAVAAYTKAIELNPKGYDALANRGEAFFQKGDFASAITDLTAALNLHPQESIHLRRGDAYLAAKQYDLAVADYTQVITKNPTSGQAFYNRGMAYFRGKNRDAAIADFTKVIELNPASAQAYARRGSAYGAKEVYDAAIADFTKAVELDPKNAETRTYRGISFYNKGKYAEAITDFEKALGIAPDDFRAAYGMARSHARLNHADQACKWLAQSIKSGFNNIDYIRHDPDLESIREAPCFQKIISVD